MLNLSTQFDAPAMAVHSPWRYAIMPSPVGAGADVASSRARGPGQRFTKSGTPKRRVLARGRPGARRAPLRAGPPLARIALAPHARRSPHPFLKDRS
jgi:hypothetical protein